MFEFEIPKPRTISLRELENIKAVYFIFVDDELFYIGSTSDLKRRIIEHYSNKFYYFKKRMKCSYIEEIDNNKRDGLEAKFIKKYRPKGNSRISLWNKKEKRYKKNIYAKTFRKTHPDYYKNYMREYRKRKADERIQKAFELLYGKEE